MSSRNFADWKLGASSTTWRVGFHQHRNYLHKLYGWSLCHLLRGGEVSACRFDSARSLAWCPRECISYQVQLLQVLYSINLSVNGCTKRLCSWWSSIVVIKQDVRVSHSVKYSNKLWSKGLRVPSLGSSRRFQYCLRRFADGPCVIWQKMWCRHQWRENGVTTIDCRLKLDWSDATKCYSTDSEVEDAWAWHSDVRMLSNSSSTIGMILLDTFSTTPHWSHVSHYFIQLGAESIFLPMK